MKGLVLNTDTKRTITIDNTHEAFDGTPYAGAEFEVVVVPMTTTQRGELAKRFTSHKRGVEVVDNTAFLKAVFDQTVKDWIGISFGQADVECSKENKIIVFDSNFDFADHIVQAARIEQERIDARWSDEAKN